MDESAGAGHKGVAHGDTGNHSMGLFNRSNGARVYPQLISTLVNAAK